MIRCNHNFLAWKSHDGFSAKSEFCGKEASSYFFLRDQLLARCTLHSEPWISHIERYHDIEVMKITQEEYLVAEVMGS